MRNFLRKIVVLVLQKEAGLCLKNNKPKIIAVCGQLNKSGLKDELVNKFKAKGLKIRGSFKGYNSEIGIPLSILGLAAGFTSPLKWLNLLIQAFKSSYKNSNYPQFLILEIAADTENEINNIIKYIRPNVLIITDFEVESTQNEGLVVYQKIIESMAGEGIVLINNDYPVLSQLKDKYPDMVITFGLEEKSDLKAIKITELENGQKFNFQYKNSGGEITLDKFGVQAIYAFLIEYFLTSYYKNT